MTKFAITHSFCVSGYSDIKPHKYNKNDKNK